MYITYLLFVEQALSRMVTDKELAEGRLYPPLENIRDVSLQIAVQLAEHAYKTGELAGVKRGGRRGQVQPPALMYR